MADLNLLSSATGANNSNIKTLTLVGIPVEQLPTQKAAEDITCGAGCRFDANGKAIQGNAANATNADIAGLSVRSQKTGEGVVLIRKGIVAGYDLSGLAFWAKVYLSDTTGKLADAAGTVSKVVGHVVPVPGTLPGSAPMKALLIEL